MKTKITLIITAVALITLSFTFANVKTSAPTETRVSTTMQVSEPVGGLFADEVLE